MSNPTFMSGNSNSSPSGLDSEATDTPEPSHALTARINELEAFNRSLIDALHNSNRIVELPSKLQDTVIQTWGPDQAQIKYRKEIFTRIKEESPIPEDRHSHSSESLHQLKAMTDLAPAIGKLGRMPKGERQALKAFHKIADQLFSIGSYFQGSYPMDHQILVWKFDDAAVDPCMRVARNEPFENPLELLGELIANLEFFPTPTDSMPLRMMQFLRDVSAWKTAKLLSERVLFGRLPPELIQMVNHAIMEQHAIPSRRFLELWGETRPQKGVGAKCLHNDGAPGLMWEHRGCLDPTCSRRTLVEWCASERCWISTHRKLHRVEVARCPRPCLGAACEGHHAEDFKDEDWHDIDGPHTEEPPWGLRKYWLDRGEISKDEWESGDVICFR